MKFITILLLSLIAVKGFTPDYRLGYHDFDLIHVVTLDQVIVTSTRIESHMFFDKHKETISKIAKEYNIPVSVMLAQAFLETGGGKSYLSINHNNFFGIKCFKGCNDQNSVQLKDDTPFDRFKSYNNAFDSFRHYANLISKSSRYKSLMQIPKSNFRDWCIGLKNAGYATDKEYHFKLIRIIEKYGLDRFDF